MTRPKYSITFTVPQSAIAAIALCNHEQPAELYRWLWLHVPSARIIATNAVVLAAIDVELTASGNVGDRPEWIGIGPASLADVHAKCDAMSTIRVTVTEHGALATYSLQVGLVDPVMRSVELEIAPQALIPNVLTAKTIDRLITPIRDQHDTVASSVYVDPDLVVDMLGIVSPGSTVANVVDPVNVVVRRGHETLEINGRDARAIVMRLRVEPDSAAVPEWWITAGWERPAPVDADVIDQLVNMLTSGQVDELLGNDRACAHAYLLERLVARKGGVS